MDCKTGKGQVVVELIVGAVILWLCAYFMFQVSMTGRHEIGKRHAPIRERAR